LNTPETVGERLAAAARHPRAKLWTLRVYYGYSRNASRRTFALRAPLAAARAVMARLHNGILLLHPAYARVTVEADASCIEPWRERFSELHGLSIVVGDAPQPAPRGGQAPMPSVRPADVTPPPRGLALGLDIGGTGMKACALREGRLLRCARAPTWPRGEAGLDSLLRRARALVIEVAAGEQPVSLGVGFASPMGVDGRVDSLSTVMRERLGEGAALDDFAERVAAGLVDGPVAFYNDLANLGLMLSGRRRRRLLRLQIGTSFGGCWIDADGTVNPAELGRLVVDMHPAARPHTYLPLRGAMKSYLSNYGVARSASELASREVTPLEVGFLLSDWLRDGDPRGARLVAWIAHLLAGVIGEASVILPGLEEVEVGGGMLQGPTGRRLREAVQARLDKVSGAPRFALSSRPGFDGAFAAALAPLREAPLRGRRRMRS